MNDFLMNPWAQIGLGILSANKPGVSAGQAIGQGGLLGIENIRRNQLADQQTMTSRANMMAHMQQLEGLKRKIEDQNALNSMIDGLNVPDNMKTAFKNNPTLLQEYMTIQGGLDVPSAARQRYEIDRARAGASKTDINVGGELPFKVPSGYMPEYAPDGKTVIGVKPIPGGPAAQRAGEVAGKEAMIDTATNYLGTIDELMFEGDSAIGDINRRVLAEKTVDGFVPGFLIPQGNKLANAYEYGIQGITRLETGAAMPPEEVKNTRRRFEPSIFDSDDVIRQKRVAYELFLRNAKKYLDPKAAKEGNWSVNVDQAMADAAKVMGIKSYASEDEAAAAMGLKPVE